jgi:hypothetical protein
MEACDGRAHPQKVVNANLRYSSSMKTLRGAVHAGRDEKTY